MMLDIEQVDKLIVDPVLDFLDMNSLAARQLITGTALTESGLKYLKQIKGPALGLWQVEPSTWGDNYRNYLNYRSKILKKFAKLRGDPEGGPEYMMWNLKYNCAHARLKYWRTPQKLPKAGDYEAMALYHKKWYNTHEGKTDVSKSVEHFKLVCERITK